MVDMCVVRDPEPPENVEFDSVMLNYCLKLQIIPFY